MKKLVKIFLSICALVFAVSCSSGFEPEVSSSQNGSSAGGNSVVSGPDDLISINESGATTRESELKAFIKKYWRNTYYDDINEYPRNIQYVLTEPFNLAYCIGTSKSEEDRQVSWFIPQVVLSSADKLQISNYARGEVRVLNFRKDGLDSYISYIIKKVSDEVLIKNKGIGGRIPALAQYKGTYSSIAQDNKVENYIAIDENGSIYFHNANISILNGNAEIKGGRLYIWENSNRKIVFKFEQGVYRRYGADAKTDLGYKKCYNYRKR